MNRPLSLHPLSLVLGLVFGVLVLLSMSQVPPLNARGINVQYLPDPRDMVQIREGTPYVVPAGKLFVLTGVGAQIVCTAEISGFLEQCSLRVNGQTELVTVAREFPSGAQGGFQAVVGSTASVVPVASGFTVTAGSIIEPRFENQLNYIGYGRAWGYLAPQ